MTHQSPIANHQSSPRIGIGFDSHRLVEGRSLVVGGVTVPFEKGLLGHSDGDVLLHAIGDAVCGAAGLPDIGQLFPDSEPRWKGADSWELLREIGRRAGASGWTVGNVDAVLVAQRPKIAPHVSAMRERIALALGIPPECVNIRGKTAEGMGPVGAGDGMEAHAVALVFRVP